MTHPDLSMIIYHFHNECCSGDQHNRDTELYVFPQTWPNTGGGLAEPGYCYGQAFIKEYTTVIYSSRRDVAQVWFNNSLGYTVNGLTDRFWDDLNNRDMKNKGHRKHYVINDNEKKGKRK